MEDIKQQLSTIIKDLYGLDVVADVTVAPEGQTVRRRGVADEGGLDSGEGRQAEFATNVAMRLAKQVGKAPREVAEEILAAMGERSGGDVKFEGELAGPGFLNFISSDEYFLDKLGDFEQNFEESISCDKYKDKLVISEFSDPNPFKVLHVGHLYTSVVGESISRLIEFAGGDVKRANFGGDVGLHVARTTYGLLRKDGVPFDGESAEIAEVLAKCYVEGTRADEEDAEAHKEIVELNKMLYRIAENGIEAPKDAQDAVPGTAVAYGGEAENPREKRVAELYWWGRQASYAYFEDFYARVGSKFERYYPESTTAPIGLKVVREQLEKGVYEESNGAVVFKGEPYGLHTRVFINAEGLPTYEAKDVGLIHKKWDDYQFDYSLVITGNDIIDYMKVVLKSIEQYNPKLVERTIHLTHGNVRLPGNEKMSSRKGNFLKAVEVLGLVEEALGKAYGEGAEVDERVALGAVKYAFLKYKIGGNIVFSVDDSVEMAGNSGPYLQYAAVRGKKVLSAVSANRLVDNTSAEDSLGWVPNASERALANKVMQYGEVLREAVDELAPHKVCTYLYELAQEFNRFYEKTKVVGSEYEAERGALVGVYVRVLEHGLGLLGIAVPESM